MGSGALVLQGTISGLAQGQQIVNVTWSLGSAVGVWLYPILAAGDNVISVPTGSSVVLVVPPTNNSVAIRMKDSAGDTGIALHPTLPCFRSIGSTVSSIILNVATPLTGPVSIAFW